jgi:hypothetical protein
MKVFVKGSYRAGNWAKNHKPNINGVYVLPVLMREGSTREGSSQEEKPGT